jgi:microcystin-dependent protein
MSFTRAYNVDVTRPDADTEHQAVMDLDADLTGAFAHLNTVDAAIAAKLLSSVIGAASGVCELDEDTLVPEDRLPDYPLAKLPEDLGYPIGAIVAFAGEAITSFMTGKWRECNGNVLLPASYPDLFALIGNRFGGTPGTDFRLPDLRGRFVRGWDHGAGKDLGAATRTAALDGTTTGDHVGTFQAGQNLSHNHDLLSYGATMDNHDGSTGTEYYSNGPDPRGIVSTTGETEFRPINVQMMFVIKVL